MENYTVYAKPMKAHLSPSSTLLVVTPAVSALADANPGFEMGSEFSKRYLLGNIALL